MRAALAVFAASTLAASAAAPLAFAQSDAPRVIVFRAADFPTTDAPELSAATLDAALDGLLRGQSRERLERGDELRPAIGVAAKIDSIHADQDRLGIEHLGPRER